MKLDVCSKTLLHQNIRKIQVSFKYQIYIYIYVKNEEIQHSSKLTAENHAIFSVPSPCTWRCSLAG